jgi:hypothetical protein
VESLRGKNLTVASAVLIALAAFGAARLFATGLFTVVKPEGPEFSREAERTAEQDVLLARDAENRGNVAAALSRYRSAAMRKPALLDRRSPEFLGAAFEERLKGWIAALRRGELRAGPTAFPDASYLFRRMYGGCG